MNLCEFIYCRIFFLNKKDYFTDYINNFCKYLVKINKIYFIQFDIKYK